MNGKKQAFVQFESEEEATEALVCKHASSLSGFVVRISFSQLQNIWCGALRYGEKEFYLYLVYEILNFWRIIYADNPTFCLFMVSLVVN